MDPLSNGDRADIMNAFERSRELGFSLIDAVQFYGVRELGKTFIKKMSLNEAVGSRGRDKRLKNPSQSDAKPSGFLASKIRKGYEPRSIDSLSSAMSNFRDFVGGDTQCATITPEVVEDWLDSGGVN